MDDLLMDRQVFPSASFKEVHPRNLTWNLKMMVSNRNLLFQGLIFRFHDKLWGSIVDFDWKFDKENIDFQR